MSKTRPDCHLLLPAGSLCSLDFRLTGTLEHLHLAEVEIWDGSGAKLPPSLLTASISSIWDAHHPPWLAVDGAINTGVHTGEGDQRPWLRVFYPCFSGSASKVSLTAVLLGRTA